MQVKLLLAEIYDNREEDKLAFDIYNKLSLANTSLLSYKKGGKFHRIPCILLPRGYIW